MDCKTFALLLDVSPEERTPDQVAQMAAHAKTCEDCALLYMLQQDCSQLDAQEELPPEFTMGWRMKVRREEAMEEKQAKKRFNWQRMLATAAAVVFVFGGATLSYVNGWGLGAQGNKNNAQQYSRSAGGAQNGYFTSANMAAESSYDSAGGMVMMAKSTANTTAAQPAKIIRTIDYTIKTLQYDADFEALKELTTAHNGYVESLSVSGDTLNGEMRRAYFTLRIPSEQLDTFLSGAKSVGVATSYSEHTQDVSETYYDTEARLETQRAKLARLNELLSQATNMSDLIEIESAISDTQYQIDSYTGRLNGYDSRINNSYVYVTLQEMTDKDAAELPDVTFIERIVNAVTESVEGMGEFAVAAVVFVVAALPWCAVLAVAAIVVKLVRKKSRKKQ